MRASPTARRQSIAAITPDDLRAMHKLLFSRKGLKVAVVGDIDAATLGPALDEIFGGLPDTEPPKAVSSVTRGQGPGREGHRPRYSAKHHRLWP